MSRYHPLVNFINRATQASHPVRLLFTVLGASLFIGTVILVVISGLALDRVLGRTWAFVSTVSIILSAPLLLMAFYSTLWSAGKFFLSKASPVPMNPPRKLIVTGLYRYTRNPMQSGVYGILIGMAILLRSPGLAILAAVWIALLTWWLVTIEEPELEKRFGQDYIEYKKRVPRFGIKYGRNR